MQKERLYTLSYLFQSQNGWETAIQLTPVPGHIHLRIIDSKGSYIDCEISNAQFEQIRWDVSSIKEKAPEVDIQESIPLEEAA